jgi:hypothetical protein
MVAPTERSVERCCQTCAHAHQWPDEDGDVYCYYPVYPNGLATAPGKEVRGTCEHWVDGAQPQRS